MSGSWRALVPVAVIILASLTARPAGPAAHETRDTLIVNRAPGSIPVRTIGGEPLVSAGELARLLEATHTWRPDLRRLVLRTHAHRMQFILDNPFAVLDDHVLRLPAAPRSVRGEIALPVALIDSLPHDGTMAQLYYDPSRAAVIVLPAAGLVRFRNLESTDSLTRLVFFADQPDDAALASRTRTHFRLRFDGFFAGALPETLPALSLVRSLRPIGSASGSAFELAFAPEAAGFRLLREPENHRVVLEAWRAAKVGLEPFAPEGRPTPAGIKVVVLDPGHGGADLGVTVGAVEEKELTLSLARLLKAELERRGAARVVLTREDDRALTGDARAEASNHARADLFVSLHFDGFEDATAHGVTAWCPPAAAGATSSGAARAKLDRARPVLVLPWRDVAERHAARSRALAEAVLSAVELRDLGPARLREFLPYSLIGVDAPGLMLECGTLTSPADLERLTAPGGLQGLAAVLADGIVAYQRSE